MARGAVPLVVDLVQLLADVLVERAVEPHLPLQPAEDTLGKLLRADRRMLRPAAQVGLVVLGTVRAVAAQVHLRSDLRRVRHQPRGPASPTNM